jgi:hypothetical protein
VSVAEAQQCGHSALVLSARDLETMPDDIGDRAGLKDNRRALRARQPRPMAQSQSA